jgi:hypothetical protein
MDLYVPQEEGADPKPLIDQLDEDEGRIKGLLLDTANLAAAAALSTVKYHDPSIAKGLERRGPVWPHQAGGRRGRRGGGRQEVFVGDSHKGALNNQGKPAYLRKKQNTNEPETRVR